LLYLHLFHIYHRNKLKLVYQVVDQDLSLPLFNALPLVVLQTQQTSQLTPEQIQMAPQSKLVDHAQHIFETASKNQLP
jgi:hypothetical protein